MNNSPSLKDNHLLATLSVSELLHFAHHLEVVHLPLGQVLYRPGCKLHHAYFPTSSVISLLYDTENGSSSEIAGIGNEGMLGVTLITGGETMLNYAVVQSDGYAFKVDAAVIRKEFNRNGQLHHLLLKYTQAFITQISQTAVCNRHHSLDEQLCRWLLMTLDRLNGIELTVTQELIAHLLGVRREGVTVASGNLQRAGLIHYRRGHITVQNRKGLEERVCECYQLVKTEFERLIPYETLDPKVSQAQCYPDNVISQLLNYHHTNEVVSHKRAAHHL
ncbi:Crp/Fnr family transcriptional regulator [Methylotenera sp.]|uniref:Crp/Fnr family transcriptional regulator n=1 Tax=Methylotenera sp. TaxID=2051956 RepID=UPI00271F32B3|nr:Crp/Fnr family transcriptional regulator [Methylotenera sp.]MDO9205730.1 Crp/Fnr family transcriptional regulator [Methylotenera sp.]MDP1522949.1 Crp/Fnr family transcriptional regulator [Methylotenera sp.]MDP2072414.1 Crp/Fnr family transcriptional regulator [Methylotenera sp.]MDP3005657.1 Crp/Fnr family transcriptional regulator [Methylotenera sp.]MDP3307026.1 Crp/Fnr family transcriptional regulator [Methylotenera sp.]